MLISCHILFKALGIHLKNFTEPIFLKVAKSRTRLSDFTFTFHFHALEKEMAAHSSVLAWRIPGTGEPGGLPSMGSHRVGHDWSDLAAVAAMFLCVCVHVHASSLFFEHLDCFCSVSWLLWIMIFANFYEIFLCKTILC